MKAVFRLLEDDEYPVLIGVCSNTTSAVFTVKNSFYKHGINLENYLTSNPEMNKFGAKAKDMGVYDEEEGIHDWSNWEIVDIIPDKQVEYKPCSFIEDYSFLTSLKALSL